MFGADGARMGEAACKVIDWKRPDFIDINFGCPVNKVVAKNGGSSLLKDLDLVRSVVAGVVGAVARHAPEIPVTAKMRIGWDQTSINALEVCRIMEGEGVRMITIHGRTRSQGYGGEADWGVIDACAASAGVPVVGNGDIRAAGDVVRRRRETRVSGVMIGRAAMENPWIFSQAKAAMEGREVGEVTWEMRKAMMLRQSEATVAGGRYGNEVQSMRAMRSRLMAYCKGFGGAKELRQKMCRVGTIVELAELLAGVELHGEPASWTGEAGEIGQ